MTCVAPQRNLTLGSPVGMGTEDKQECIPDTQQPGSEQPKSLFYFSLLPRVSLPQILGLH